MCKVYTKSMLLPMRHAENLPIYALTHNIHDVNKTNLPTKRKILRKARHDIKFKKTKKVDDKYNIRFAASSSSK